METPVVILAGGLGSRLWPLTDVQPKALIPVAGKPCVNWVVEELLNQDLYNITVCVNEDAESLFDFALDSYDSVRIDAAPKDISICTRILRNGSMLRGHSKFLVVYADDLTHTNYGRLIDCLSNADVALATTSTVPLEFGLISSQDGFVKEFIEKPNLEQLTAHSIWTGRVAMRASSLQELVGRQDLARDVFPAMLRIGKRLAVLNGNEPWYDVGSIAHWRRANEEYAKMTQVALSHNQ